jgi:uncharacterized protein YdeI (YjbR/CyaY-like superfamily)
MPKIPVNIRIFPTAASFRTWLKANHKSAEVMWVGFHKQGAPKKSINYKEALDEALCYGWIDGVRKSVDAITFAIRFTPRKKKSKWSQVNIRRLLELIAEGRVRPAGLTAFERRTTEKAQYSYETRPRDLPEPYRSKFQKNKKAWEFYSAQAPWYRRTSTWWIVSAKQEETRQRRLATLIDDSAHGRRLAMLRRKEPKTKKSS